MDRKTLKKMKEAQEKAEESMKFNKLASDSKNKEFWEKALKTLEENKQTFLNNLEETEFLIQKYMEKIKLFG